MGIHVLKFAQHNIYDEAIHIHIAFNINFMGGGSLRGKLVHPPNIIKKVFEKKEGERERENLLLF